MSTPRAILKERETEIAKLDGVLLPVGGEASGRELPAEVTTSTYYSKAPKQRRYSPATIRLYERLTEIARTIPLEKAALMYDKAQRPFRVPKHLRDQGWPDSWVEAWKDKDGGFRKKLSDLRQSAWQWKSSK
jgi:hypothetical protein